MKKVITFLLIAALALSLTSCSLVGYNSPFQTEPPLTDVEVTAQVVLSGLRSRLRNPDSLQVHGVNYVDTYTGGSYYTSEFPTLIETDFKYIFKIDYSGQNGFGGMNRETIHVCVYNDGSVVFQEPGDLWGKQYNSTYMLSSPDIPIDISKLAY